MTDKIFITNIQTEAVIGVRPEERIKKQRLFISIELTADLKPAGKTDNLQDTIDYSSLKKAVVRYTEESSFFLLEALAQGIADLCTALEGVSETRVKLEKPDVYDDTESVGVEIIRKAELEEPEITV